jgi:hypothetical protein
MRMTVVANAVSALVLLKAGWNALVPVWLWIRSRNSGAECGTCLFTWIDGILVLVMLFVGKWATLRLFGQPLPMIAWAAWLTSVIELTAIMVALGSSPRDHLFIRVGGTSRNHGESNNLRPIDPYQPPKSDDFP